MSYIAVYHTGFLDLELWRIYAKIMLSSTTSSHLFDVSLHVITWSCDWSDSYTRYQSCQMHYGISISYLLSCQETMDFFPSFCYQYIIQISGVHMCMSLHRWRDRNTQEVSGNLGPSQYKDRLSEYGDLIIVIRQSWNHKKMMMVWE